MLATAGWLVGWVLLWHLPLLKRFGSNDIGASEALRKSVTVVIPARNEAVSLPLLLADLSRQETPPARIIVIDDCSEDGTAELATAAGATVLNGLPLPVGWAGKSWALQQAVPLLQSERVLFLDADVRLAPDAIGRLAAEHASRGGLVSVAPYHRIERVFELGSAVFNTVAVMAIGAGWPARNGRAQGAFGPAMMCSAEDYLRSGGHAADPGDVLDDLALAARFQQCGLPTTVLSGGETFAYRMYGAGPTALIEGWSKNIAAGATRAPRLGSIGVALWVTGLGLPLVAVITAPVVALVAYLAFTAQCFILFRRVGRFGAAAPLHPVLAALFVAIFLRSVVLVVVLGRVPWRGRSIPVRQNAAATKPRRQS